MSRRATVEMLSDVVRAALGPNATIHHVNWGDSHRRMLLDNRRHERAFQRSRRNQPPRTGGRS